MRGVKGNRENWPGAAHLVSIMAQMDDNIARQVVEDMKKNVGRYSKEKYSMMVTLLAKSSSPAMRDMLKDLYASISESKNKKIQDKQAVVLKYMRFAMKLDDLDDVMKILQKKDASPDNGIAAADVSSIQGTGFQGGITERDIKASPLARKLAEKTGVDLSTVQGTGAGEKIMKKDVERAAAAAASSGSASITSWNLSRMIVWILSRVAELIGCAISRYSPSVALRLGIAINNPFSPSITLISCTTNSSSIVMETTAWKQ